MTTPDTTAAGASGQGAAPTQTAAQPSGVTAPAAASGAAPSQAGASKPTEASRASAILQIVKERSGKAAPLPGTGSRNEAEGRAGTTGKDGGDQKPEADGQVSPGDKPHPNSSEAKNAKKLADDLANARHVLRRAKSKEEMELIDKFPDTAILTLAEQQRALDRLYGSQASRGKAPDRPTDKPAERGAGQAKGTGEGPDDLLPAEPDDDPLAEPSPSPKTSGQQTLRDSLRVHLKELEEQDPELATKARDQFRQVRDHYQREVQTVRREIEEHVRDNQALANRLAETHLSMAFQGITSDYPQLADPEAQTQFLKTYQKRWDPDLVKVIGDPKLLLEDFKALAAVTLTKATPAPNDASRGGQPPAPGNTGRGGTLPGLTRDQVLLETAKTNARTDLTDAQKQAEVGRIKSRLQK